MYARQRRKKKETEASTSSAEQQAQAARSSVSWPRDILLVVVRVSRFGSWAQHHISQLM